MITAAKAAGQPGYEVLVTGDATLSRDLTKLSESDLQKGEAIGIPIALVILVIVFGAVVAALLPVLLAVFAIVVGIAAIALIGQISPLSFFAVNMLTLMGLAVGIDYCLFIVSPLPRGAAPAGPDIEAAIERSAGTAGRAVMFSGLTVVLALVGMLIVPTTIFISLAVGRDPGRADHDGGGPDAAARRPSPARRPRSTAAGFGRCARAARAGRAGRILGADVRAAMRRPGLSATRRCLCLLLIAAIPVLSINTGAAGICVAARQPGRKAGIRRPQP